MIGVVDIEDIIQIAVKSGGLKDEKALSIALISDTGGGKTSILKKTHQRGKVKKVKVPGRKKGDEKEIEVRDVAGSVLYCTDTTPFIIRTRYAHLLKSGQIHHIAVPDFLSILNQPKHILEGHVKFYNALVEEGILSIETRDGTFLSEMPVTIGLLTAIAKEEFDNRRDSWSAVGFLSRILPVSWSYTPETAAKIRKSIKIKDYLKELDSFNIHLPNPQETVNIPADLADIIEHVALATKDNRDKLAARRQKQLQVFCMANALKDGRHEVNDDDILKLKQYQRYFNWNCTAEI